MGEYADMALDGMVCELCSEFIGDSIGHTRLCEDCKKEDTFPKKAKCHICNKEEELTEKARQFAIKNNKSIDKYVCRECWQYLDNALVKE